MFTYYFYYLGCNHVSDNDSIEYFAEKSSHSNPENANFEKAWLPGFHLAEIKDPGKDGLLGLSCLYKQLNTCFPSGTLEFL